MLYSHFLFLSVFAFLFNFVGLHLRSIEEPQSRMPAEQGDAANVDIGTRNVVPLQMPNCHQSSYEYDAEYCRMESWLDENPEFVQDYFIRCVCEACDAVIIS